MAQCLHAIGPNSKRIELITDIACLFLHAHMVFTEACSLLSVKYGSTNRFALTDETLYPTFARKLSREAIMPNAAGLLSGSAVSHVFVVERTVKSWATEFSSLDENSPASPFCLWNPKRPDYPSSFVLNVNRQLETDGNISAVFWRSTDDPLKKERYFKPEPPGPNSWRTWKGNLDALFRVFTTDRVINVLDSAQHDDTVQEDAVSKLQSIVDAVQNIIVSHDDGRAPEPFVDRNVIHTLVSDETKCPGNGAKYTDAVRKAFYNYSSRNEFTRAIAKMDARFELESINSNVFGPIRTPGTVYFLPELRKGKGNGGYSGNLVFGPRSEIQYVFIPQNLSDKTAYWRNFEYQSPGSRVCTNVMAISKLCRYADTQALETMVRELHVVDVGMEQMFRFMNGARGFLATELLLETV